MLPRLHVREAPEVVPGDPKLRGDCGCLEINRERKHTRRGLRPLGALAAGALPWSPGAGAHAPHGDRLVATAHPLTVEAKPAVHGSAAGPGPGSSCQVRSETIKRCCR